MGALSLCCHIFGMVILFFALAAACVGAGVPWVYAAADYGEGNAELRLLSLWGRTIERSRAPSDTRSWQTVFRGNMNDNWCPEPGKPNSGAFSRIQAAEAFSIITVAFVFIHICVCFAYVSGRLSRFVILIPGIVAIACAVVTILTWNAFLTYCDESYCSIYTSTAEAQGGTFEGTYVAADPQTGQTAVVSLPPRENARCYMYVGFAFEIVAAGLVTLAYVPLCLGFQPRRSVVAAPAYVQ